MSKFKVGDKVLLANLDNPYGGSYNPSLSNPFDVVGLVVSVGGDPYLPLTVRWGNGRRNIYQEPNLRHMLLEENV